MVSNASILLILLFIHLNLLEVLHRVKQLRSLIDHKLKLIYAVAKHYHFASH